MAVRWSALQNSTIPPSPSADGPTMITAMINVDQVASQPPSRARIRSSSAPVSHGIAGGVGRSARGQFDSARPRPPRPCRPVSDHPVEPVAASRERERMRSSASTWPILPCCARGRRTVDRRASRPRILRCEHQLDIGLGQTAAVAHQANHSVGAAEQRDREGEASALAVLRLRTSSIFADCWTGRSAGFSPLRILPV